MKDPLNFYYQFNLSTTLTMTQNILNWDHSIGGDQWFADTASCDKMDHQRSNYLIAPKNHTRMEWSNSNAGITASPMHHDILTWCGDVADSFNSARNAAKSVHQSAGYFVPYTYTANTSSMLQCDGRWTSGDGYYARVYQ